MRWSLKCKLFGHNYTNYRSSSVVQKGERWVYRICKRCGHVNGNGLKSKMNRLKIQAIYYSCYTIMAISIIAMWIIAFPFLLMADWSEGMVNKYNVAHQLCKIKPKRKKNS